MILSLLPLVIVFSAGVGLTVWIAALRHAGRPVPRILQVGRIICAGVRNEAPLKLHDRGRLWFFPDGSMYVYYTPTHWRYQPK